MREYKNWMGTERTVLRQILKNGFSSEVCESKAE